jgi:hypothetical protein
MTADKHIALVEQMSGSKTGRRILCYRLYKDVNRHMDLRTLRSPSGSEAGRSDAMPRRTGTRLSLFAGEIGIDDDHGFLPNGARVDEGRISATMHAALHQDALVRFLTVAPPYTSLRLVHML